MMTKEAGRVITVGIFIGFILVTASCAHQTPIEAVSEESNDVSQEITVYESPT